MLCPQRTQSERPKAWSWLWYTNLKQSSWVKLKVKVCWIWNKTFRIRYGTRFIDTDTESGIIYQLQPNEAKWYTLFGCWIRHRLDFTTSQYSVYHMVVRLKACEEWGGTESSAPISLANDWSMGFLARKQSFLLGLLWGSISLSPSLPLSPVSSHPPPPFYFYFYASCIHFYSFRFI